MAEDESPKVLCFGEVLWDSLPRGLFPGGAPMNVAYHLRQLGLRPLLVTAVGRDLLGEELVSRLEVWGLDTRGVTVHPDRRTGLNRVEIVDGNPRFRIATDVAWDEIGLPDAMMEEAPQCAALVFGTLAQRSAHNRRQLATLLDTSPKALKVLDVNLRPPFDDAEIAWALARRADLVKVNEQELMSLLGESFLPAGLADAVRRFAERAGVERVCVTAGSRGAGLLHRGRWSWRSVRPVAVRDSVGAGDAFLAGLLFGLLRGDDAPETTLRRASRLARFAVTQDGATPAYNLDSEGNVVA